MGVLLVKAFIYPVEILFFLLHFESIQFNTKLIMICHNFDNSSSYINKLWKFLIPFS